MIIALVLFTIPGFVEADGGVAQEADVTESVGWRCDADPPLKLTIEGKALMYVEILTPKPSKFLTLDNGARPIILDYIPPFSKIAGKVKGPRKLHTEFSIDVADGPQPFVFHCPAGSLVKLVSVEKVGKKIPIVR